MKLITGLGNPGQDYAHTRHNAGWLALDALATDLTASFSKDTKHQSETAKAQLGTDTILLAKPTTFMNRSGEAVQSLMAYYKIKPEDILILQDEMDIAPGAFKFTLVGGTGGHNGIASIFDTLGLKQLARMRIGIGRPDKLIPSEDYALQKIDDATQELCHQLVAPLKDWIEHGLAKAMNTWNKTTS